MAGRGLIGGGSLAWALRRWQVEEGVTQANQSRQQELEREAGQRTGGLPAVHTGLEAAEASGNYPMGEAGWWIH